VNLGWKLAAVVHGRSDAALPDTYEAERRPVSQRLLMHTRAQIALIAPGPEVTALRELFTELLADPRTVAHIAGLLSGADICYPAEPHEHPLVGRWAPDLTLATADGSRRLAELTRDGRPMLLEATGAGLAARLTNGSDHIAVVVGRQDGQPPASALLVRPDGYVVWATSADPPDTTGLDEAALRWFGTKLIGGA